MKYQINEDDKELKSVQRTFFDNVKGKTLDEPGLESVTGDFLLPNKYKWYPSDTETHFKSLSAEHQAKWKDVEFIYFLNEFGMRTQHRMTADRDSICFIGCSMTFGLGMPKENTWTHLLAKQLGLNDINMGNPGGSLDAMYRVYSQWLPKLKSKITVCLIPPRPRKERIEQNRNGVTHIHKLSNWNVQNETDEQRKEILLQNFNDTEMFINERRNLNAIKTVARENDSTLVIVDQKELNYHGLVTLNDDYARDGIHPGYTWHNATANEIERRLASDELVGIW